MPRPELLSPAERAALVAVPVDRAGLIEHYILSQPDLAWVRQHRGAHNRLGVAVQLALLRFPGRALQPEETPPAELVEFLAGQVNADSGDWLLYASRAETRRDHHRALLSYLGLRPFSLSAYRALSAAIAPTALQTDRGYALVAAILDEIRRRSLIQPRIAVLERLCGPSGPISAKSRVSAFYAELSGPRIAA